MTGNRSRRRDRVPGARLSFGRVVVATMVSVLLLGAGNATAARAPWERVEVIQELLNGAEPQRDAIQLDLPAVTQDGSSVAVTVDIESPMTQDDHVERLYLFALGNPSPELLEVRFTPLSGRAGISTRIRLDSSQTVVALARTSDGDWLADVRDVRVTVSGCLSRDDTYASEDLMQTRVRVPPNFERGESAEVRTLIQHPMETGLRTDASDRPIPENIVRSFEAHLDGAPVVTARLHRAIAANPFLLFHVAPERSGELSLSWEEDTGDKAQVTAAVRVD